MFFENLFQGDDGRGGPEAHPEETAAREAPEAITIAPSAGQSPRGCSEETPASTATQGGGEPSSRPAWSEPEGQTFAACSEVRQGG